MTQDQFYKQTISFTLNRQSYSFNVSQELFSSHAIDAGTQRLLRTLLHPIFSAHPVHSIQTNRQTPKKILDLGCGYGPIGIVLAQQNPQAEVHFVDRDALAIEYAKQNVNQNKLKNKCRFYASLGYDSVKDNNFDLIVSNIPAKVGEQVLEHFLYDAQQHLSKNGSVAIVVVEEINKIANKLLTENENIKITLKKSWPGHHVYHYEFLTSASQTTPPAFESGKYVRAKHNFYWDNHEFQLTTTYHLREFDQLGFDTQLLLNNLENVAAPVQSVIVINPGQGYIPLAVAKKTIPQKIILVDRDLQALKTSRANLVQAEYPAENIILNHQVNWDIEAKPISALIGVIPEKQSIQVYEMWLEQASEILESMGQLLLSSTSTTIYKLEKINKKQKHFEVVAREKNKGMSCVLLQKR